jgi:hypothetical protein
MFLKILISIASLRLQRPIGPFKETAYYKCLLRYAFNDLCFL